jgi:hypothetical protein
MISLAPSLAVPQNVFFGWVSLSEQKWVILAERRGIAPEECRFPEKGYVLDSGSPNILWIGVRELHRQARQKTPPARVQALPAACFG